MTGKKKLLKNSKLYLILDAQVNNYNQLFEITKKAVAVGVDIIQLRDKTGSSKDILKISKRLIKFIDGKIPFILNDRADLSLAIFADGVHLGQDDLPLKDARKILGNKAIIGVSCQNFNHAKKAQDDGADYIGFGSVFKTQTKPDRSPMNPGLLKRVARNIKIPVFAIGGIDMSNVEKVKNLGITRFAVCRAICNAKDVKKAVRDFKSSRGDS